MTAQDILCGIKSHFKKTGWTRGSFYRWSERYEKPQFCAVGLLRYEVLKQAGVPEPEAATVVGMPALVAKPEALKVYDECLSLMVESAPLRATVGRFSRRENRITLESLVMTFNDATHRKKAEVEEVFVEACEAASR